MLTRLLFGRLELSLVVGIPFVLPANKHNTLFQILPITGFSLPTTTQLILISGHSAPEGRNFTSALQLSFSFIDQPYFFKLMQLCFQS
jgi:hypothetical protein